MRRFAGNLIKAPLVAGLLAAVALSGAHAGTKSHGLSIFGELKYPKDFKHFDYVNPDAPKGGRLSTVGGISFDTFNPLHSKGR